MMENLNEYLWITEEPHLGEKARNCSGYNLLQDLWTYISWKKPEQMSTAMTFLGAIILNWGELYP